MVTSKSYRKTFDLANNLKSLRRASNTLLQVVSSNSFSSPGIRANLPQPPFPHLLRSNIPPTENETSLIRDVIVIAEEEESRLKEMESSHSTGSDRLTSKTVRKLTHELGRARQFIIEHNAILSSIRRIPPEILQNIFIHTLPTTETPGTKVLRSSQLPWALSQVCQLWRTIMLSFSDMWTDLPIVDLKEAYTTEKPFLDLLTELLKRSHNMPIRLTIEEGWDRHVAHPAIDILVLQSDRWQEIKINHCDFALLSAFKKIKGRLSSLQSLYLNLYSPYYPPFPNMPEPINYAVHDLFEIAPRLRHVHYDGPPPEQLLFPTHQLVHYSQTGEHLEQVIQTMSSSPSLRNLAFHVLPDTTTNALPKVDLTLPNLIVLDAFFYTFYTIHGSFSTIYEPFFNSITTPALEVLLVQNGTDNTITPIRSMLLRSRCLLKILYLRVILSPGDLQSVLSLTPLVTKLTITIPPAEDISALMFDGNTPPLLPLLQECEFLKRHNNHRFDLSMETIQALKLLASSRCELPDDTTSGGLSGEFHPLRTFRISLDVQSLPHRQYFEGWANSDMAKELYKLHGDLLDVFPEFVLHYIPANRKFDLKWKNQVTSLLTQLETLKIEKASDICVSGIQYIVYAISIRFNEKDVRFSSSLIAKRILKKWEPILRDDIPNIRWLSTASFLEYLPTTQNHALRSSPDAMKLFYYGLDINDISVQHYEVLYASIADELGLGHHI